MHIRLYLYFLVLFFGLLSCKPKQQKNIEQANASSVSSSPSLKLFNVDDKNGFKEQGSINFSASDFKLPAVSKNDPSYLVYFGFVQATVDQNLQIKDSNKKDVIAPGQCGYFAFLKDNQNIFILPQAKNYKEFDRSLFQDPETKDRLIGAGLVCMNQKGSIASFDNASLHGVFAADLETFVKFFGYKNDDKLALTQNTVRSISKALDDIAEGKTLKRSSSAPSISRSSSLSASKQDVPEEPLVFGVKKNEFSSFLDGIDWSMPRAYLGQPVEIASRKADDPNFTLVSRQHLGTGAGGSVERLTFKSKKAPYTEYSLAVKKPDESKSAEIQDRQAKDLLEEAELMKVMGDLYPGISETGVKMHFAHNATIGEKKIPVVCLELIDGGDVDNSWKFFKPEEKADMLIQMSSKIGGFNDAGLVHGDVALRNMLYSKKADGIVDLRVADYGLTTVNSNIAKTDDPLEKARLEQLDFQRIQNSRLPMGQSVPEVQIYRTIVKFQTENPGKEFPPILADLVKLSKTVDMHKTDGYSFSLEAWSQIRHGKDANKHFLETINQKIIKKITDEMKAEGKDQKEIDSATARAISLSYSRGNHTAQFLEEIKNSDLSEPLKNMFIKSLDPDPKNRPTMTEMSKILEKERDSLTDFIRKNSEPTPAQTSSSPMESLYSNNGGSYDNAGGSFNNYNQYTGYSFKEESSNYSNYGSSVDQPESLDYQEILKIISN